MSPYPFCGEVLTIPVCCMYGAAIHLGAEFMSSRPCPEDNYAICALNQFLLSANLDAPMTPFAPVLRRKYDSPPPNPLPRLLSTPFKEM